MPRVVPKIPKEYFSRPNIPPEISVFDGKPEEKRHRRYRIYLGEYIRDSFPFAKIRYDYDLLPSFFHARHNRFLNYYPDIWIEQHDDIHRVSYFSVVELNGPIHYKTKDQILKVIERKNLVFPTIRVMKYRGKETYKTIASYVIFDVDDFEYNPIDSLYKEWKSAFYSGDLYPSDIEVRLNNMFKVAF